MTAPVRRRIAVALAAMVFAALAAPQAASADAPTAYTDSHDETAPDAVTLHGTVYLGGEPTRFHFEYAPAASDFCSSNATSGTPETTVEKPAHYDGESVETDVTGLTPGTELCFRLIANNASGTGAGALQTLTVGAPYVETAAKQRNISASSSALRGWIQGAGQQVDYHFEWGVPPDCTTHSTPSATLDPGAEPNLEAIVDGLTPGARYCFRLVGSNPSATRNGSVVSFTAGLPQLGPPSASATGPTTEALSQTLNPAGQDTTYHVEYDSFRSYYCYFWEHALPPPTYSTSSGTLAGSAGETRIPTTLDGLTPGGEYCSRLIATNATGTSEDDPYDRWTAGAPAAQMIAANALGSTTARLRATVNPAGAAASVSFMYTPLGTGSCSRHGSPDASSTSPQAIAGDTSDHEITAKIDGLTPGAHYCAWIVATNDRTSVESNAVSFATDPAGSSGPPGGSDPPGGSPAPLLRSFSVPARVASPRFAFIPATVELGRPGTTVTLSAYRVIRGATGSRVGLLHRKVARAGRHRLKLSLTSKSRRQLAGLASVRLRAKLVVEGPGGRRATRIADLQLSRHG